MQLDKIFEALASVPRRNILAYLSEATLTAGQLAQRFDISKPSLSKHLSILENAGLIRSERKGQFIHYSLVRENLVNTLNGYLQNVCPVGRPLKKESRRLAQRAGASDGISSVPPHQESAEG
ncbi:MAG: metalloregulator ArsR/SmtB family transcription factor [Holosporales bacterium]|jgi:ArsR family transcriptional regulator